MRMEPLLFADENGLEWAFSKRKGVKYIFSKCIYMCVYLYIIMKSICCCNKKKDALLKLDENLIFDDEINYDEIYSEITYNQIMYNEMK